MAEVLFVWIIRVKKRRVVNKENGLMINAKCKSEGL
jgi:hypothetical protein